MKHLKTYKIFESVSEDFDIEENIKELFFQLEDEGFDITVEPNYSSASRDEVFSWDVVIRKRWGAGDSEMLSTWERGNYGPKFPLVEVLPQITMCSGYLRDNGWRIWDVDSIVVNNMGRFVSKDLAFISNLDPRIDFSNPSPVFDHEVVKLKLLIRRKK